MKREITKKHISHAKNIVVLYPSKEFTVYGYQDMAESFSRVEGIKFNGETAYASDNTDRCYTAAELATYINSEYATASNVICSKW